MYYEAVKGDDHAIEAYKTLSRLRSGMQIKNEKVGNSFKDKDEEDDGNSSKVKDEEDDDSSEEEKVYNNSDSDRSLDELFQVQKTLRIGTPSKYYNNT